MAKAPATDVSTFLANGGKITKAALHDCFDSALRLELINATSQGARS